MPGRDRVGREKVKKRPRISGAEKHQAGRRLVARNSKAKKVTVFVTVSCTAVFVTCVLPVAFAFPYLTGTSCMQALPPEVCAKR